MTVIATTCNVGCGLACGILSDRVGRRTLFAAVGAVLLAVGMGCLALASNWTGLQWAAVFYGSGIGMFSTIDLALIIQILPSVHQAGEVLGIMNLCNTVAQVVAPSLALLVLEERFTKLPAAVRTGRHRLTTRCCVSRRRKRMALASPTAAVTAFRDVRSLGETRSLTH